MKIDSYKRIIGLDVGDRRIGVAVSDELRITAQAVCTIERSTPANDFAAVKKLAEEYDAAAVVAGLPKKLDGTSSPQTEKVQQFLDGLRKHVEIPVLTWDERFTTTSAEASLIEADVGRKARKKIIDAVAAQIMLQHYLDCTRSP
ncbi:MAG: Holliday junction resolvase RuvX [Candidatus Abyssobacteria bacterium SURF_5]|uniref:Putative pre-16S rRNA nuclease n=1 Tax=Abyssobacteria bacterium (strain SURF_5) TaxID=2093360 RepID=A0A3A4NT74_ABYX5|nr:MAG: Holliday junction resolvase RuvX [Candidatus Abyssubacteria bacterium SURF_5]